VHPQSASAEEGGVYCPFDATTFSRPDAPASGRRPRRSSVTKRSRLLLCVPTLERGHRRPDAGASGRALRRGLLPLLALVNGVLEALELLEEAEGLLGLGEILGEVDLPDAVLADDLVGRALPLMVTTRVARSPLIFCSPMIWRVAVEKQLRHFSRFPASAASHIFWYTSFGESAPQPASPTTSTNAANATIIRRMSTLLNRTWMGLSRDRSRASRQASGASRRPWRACGRWPSARR